MTRFPASGFSPAEKILYYNTKRLQRNLGILTPMEQHEQFDSAA